MRLGYKRDDLRALAQAKLDDATILLQNNRFANAYYLAGYAVEIGLKACIARRFVAEMIPDRAFVNEIYRHKLEDLVTSAGLSAQLKDERDKDHDFAANWGLAKEWTPEARYASTDPRSAQELIAAIADPTSGVFKWTKAHW